MYTYLNELLNLHKPEWTTPNEIIYQDEAVILRKFSEGKEMVLIVPPQAGHHSCIADYGPNQSLVQHFINKHHSVYTIEWISCNISRCKETIIDLINQLNTTINIINNPLILIGLCQGGWLSVMVAANYPEKVKELWVAGAPLDFGAGDGPIKRIVENTPPISSNMSSICLLSAKVVNVSAPLS